MEEKLMATPIAINKIPEFEAFDILGRSALFTDSRVDRESIPEGYYAYDLRGCDDDPGYPATVENHVMVNFTGTVITRTPIELPENGYICLSDDDWGYVDHFNEFGPKFAYDPQENMWKYVA